MTKTVCYICGEEMPIKDFNSCISSYGRVWYICDKCRERFNKFINEQKAERIKCIKRCPDCVYQVLPIGSETCVECGPLGKNFKPTESEG